MEYALKVQVNDQLILDAGTLVADAPDAAHGTVRPPAVPMVEQVLAFLTRQPAEPDAEVSEAELAQVTTAVCLRYGTWFALLSDEARPAARVPKGTSRIDDGEMARINIEASAALARWLDLRRESPATFRQLVLRALKHLPAQPGTLANIPKRPILEFEGKRVKHLHLALPAMTVPELTGPLVRDARDVLGDRFPAREAQATGYPTRVLSNIFIKATWDLGAAGKLRGAPPSQPLPLAACKIPPRERDGALRHLVSELVRSLPAVERMIDERGRTWPEKVLPFTVLDSIGIDAGGWPLTGGAPEITA